MTYRIVMLCGCGESAPEQVSPEQGRQKSVHAAWIPNPLLFSNIDITYGLHNSVLKLSPWIFAALRNRRCFLYPV